MKRFRVYLLVLVLIIGIVLYFWQPWGTRQQAVDLGNAADVVKACQAETGELANYKYQTDISVGEQIKVAILNRVVREGDKRQMVDLTWDIPKMSGTANMYAEGNKVYIFHPLKDRWILPNEDPTVNPFMDFFWRQLSLVDPVDNILKVDPMAKDVSLYREGSDEGADSVAVQVIPKADALSEINKSLPPQFAGGELADVRQFYWISQKDYLVTRYEVRAKVAFFGIKTLEFRTISIPDNYNNTSITLPKPLLDKMKK